MNQYSECMLHKEKDHVCFTSKAVALLEQDERFERLSIPSWWETAICRKLDIFTSYTAYYCCIYALPHGFYNKVTDYKGIWKLAGLPQGNREFSYDVDEGRVYGGFIEEKHPIKLRHDANVVILLPKEEKLDDAGCIQLWKAHQIGFMKHPSSTFFTELRNLLPQAYILHYEETGEAALEVWGKDVEQRFKEADATGENAGTIER